MLDSNLCARLSGSRNVDFYGRKMQETPKRWIPNYNGVIRLAFYTLIYVSMRHVYKEGLNSLLSFSNESKEEESVVTPTTTSSSSGSHESWDYTFNGDDWEGLCHNGDKQSPIDITRKWTSYKYQATPLELINYDQEVAVSIKVIQHHYTVKVLPDPNSRIAISGGGLRGNYVLQQAHIHFGSEHLLNSQRYALEVHLVHFREIYGNRSQPALNDPEGIAVLGTLFCFSKKNTNLQKMIEGTNGQDVKLNFRDFLPDNLDFYRYYGSLTTPPCSEAVVWTVFKNRASMSTEQLIDIKNIFPEKVHTTYRNVQPLNERDVEMWEFHTDLNKVNFLKSSPNLLVMAPLLAHNVHGIF